jgi:hypothetical protein
MPDGDDRKQRQARLRERFLDLGNAYVRLRMTFLRSIGLQPPEDESEKRRRER